jgi:hypothetical protein
MGEPSSVKGMVRIVLMALGVLLAVWFVFMIIGMIFAALKVLLIIGLILAVVVGGFMFIGGVRRRV